MSAKWFDKPVRMMRWDLLGEYEKVKEIDLGEWAREKREKWHSNCEWLVGVPGQSPGTGHLTTFEAEGFERYPGFEDFDLLRRYLPHARRQGIRVLVYLNMHWYSYEFAAKHPSWEQLTSSGESYGRLFPLYGNGTTLCINSPWRDWAFKLIRETIRTGVDGVFLDGPVVFPDCCYCEHCQEKFQRMYHEPIPKEDWRSSIWKDFLRFREESMAEFLRDARSAMKEINPGAVIFLNAGGWHASGWRVARDIQKVGLHQDFNGAEEFFHPTPSAKSIFATAIMAKYLVAGGKPAVVFTHHALGSWHYKFLPPWEIKLAIAQTVACGANPWFAFFSHEHGEGKSEPSTTGEIQAFLEKNEQFYEGSRSEATVALHHSSQTSTFYICELPELYRDLGTGKEQDLIADTGTGRTVIDWSRRKLTCERLQGASFSGYCSALMRAHVPFDVVLDAGITEENLKRYESLILPNSACLSDRQIDAIKAFVERGGNLIASFEAGRFNERGDIRGVQAMDDLLGVEQTEGMFPPMLGENYMLVKARYGDFIPGQLLPRGPYCLKVTAKPGAEVPIAFLDPIPSFYMPLSKESRYPALILHKHGRGRTAYFPQLLGAFYDTNKIEDMEKLITTTVRGMSQNVPIEVDAPPTVLAELRSQQEKGGRLVLHLVNCTGDMQRPVRGVVPVKDIRVKVKAPAIQRVRKLSNGEEVKFKRSGDWVSFALSELGFYEVIVAE